MLHHGRLVCAGFGLPREVLRRPCNDAGWRRLAQVGGQASRQQDAEAFPQPDFGEISTDKANKVGEETPDKTVFTHNTTTGHTPCHMPGWIQLTYKINCARPGVPGEECDEPIHLATPKRHKTGAGSQWARERRDHAMCPRRWLMSHEQMREI